MKLRNAAEGRKIWDSVVRGETSAEGEVELLSKMSGASQNSFYRAGPWVTLQIVGPVLIKCSAVRENTPVNNTMMDNIRKIIREEDGIRAEAASKIKARIKANENKNGIEAMKSLLNKRIAAKKNML